MCTSWYAVAWYGARCVFWGEQSSYRALPGPRTESTDTTEYNTHLRKATTGTPGRGRPCEIAPLESPNLEGHARFVTDRTKTEPLEALVALSELVVSCEAHSERRRVRRPPGAKCQLSRLPRVLGDGRTRRCTARGSRAPCYTRQPCHTGL